MPFGYRSDTEFSSIRVESTQLAATMTVRPSDLALLAGHAVEVLDALRPPAIVHEDARDDGVGADLELPGLQRERNQVVGGVEEGGRVAAAPAGAAVVAGREAADRPRHVGTTAADDRHAERAGGSLQQSLAAARGRRRQEVLAAGERVRVIVSATHADELVHLVVVGRDVLVADGPGNLPAVAFRSRELEVAIAQADAAPDVGLAAEAPDPPQVEGPALRREDRLLLLAEEEVRRRLAAPPALPLLVRQDVRPVLRSIELRPRIEETDLDALPGQVPRRHPAGRTAADDDDGVDAGRA